MSEADSAKYQLAALGRLLTKLSKGCTGGTSDTKQFRDGFQSALDAVATGMNLQTSKEYTL